MSERITHVHCSHYVNDYGVLRWHFKQDVEFGGITLVGG